MTSNREARGELRQRQVRRAAWTGLTAKAAMFLPTLGIAWVALPVMGTERYGVLATVLSLLAIFAMADLGVGASLVTLISRAVGAGNGLRVRQLQSNGLAVATAISLLLFAAGAMLLGTDIGSFFFPHSAPAVRSEATMALSGFAMVFALSLPLAQVGKVQLGLQQGDIANYWQIASALINFAAGSAAALSGLGVVWIVVSLMSGTLACGAANLLLHFRNHPAMRPRLGDVGQPLLGELLRDSGFYFALQVIFALAYAMDTLIIARTLGAGEASAYALSERLFSVVAVAVSVITGPMWAAYGDALGANDHQWAFRMLWRVTARIAGAAAILSLALVLMLKPLIGLLSSGQLAVPVGLAVAMAIWRVVEAAGASLSTFLYAHRALRLVVGLGALTAIASLAGKFLLLPRVGMIAMPVAMCIAYLLLCLAPALIYLGKASRQASGETRR